ncbi:hypothetical protein MBLNU230_g2814t1 [Neophaeotheca triangularis]
MSVAILPSSPMTYSLPSLSSPQQAGPLPSKRPKLSLNTSNVPTLFGKGNTSLRLDTLSTTSPTSRNTFSNARDREGANTAHNQPALLPLNSSGKPRRPCFATSLQTEVPLSVEPVSSSADSATSTSTNDSVPDAIPYKLPFNTVSILVNGPIPRDQHRRMSFSQSRPMFPTPKKVSFKAPLTEDIKNEKFTTKHSDLESSSSTISTLELSPPEGEALKNKAGKVAGATKAVVPQSPRLGEKRESSDEEDSDSDKCPATPVAGRKKRHRDWVWTLGPIESKKQDQQPDMAGIGGEKAEVT